jgi:uncharacterized membrane protein YkvA (DUF1232 family)
MARRSYRGHPLVKLAGTAARLPRYLNLAQGLARDGSVPVARKSALVGGLGYAILPFDLIPGIIPVVGQLDDLAALLLGLRVALRGCPSDVAQAHLARAGIADTAIDADLQTVRDAAAWIMKGGAAIGVKAIAAPLRLIAGIGRRPLL